MSLLLIVAVILAWAPVADAQAASLTLSFTDNATNETGFKVERCQGPACAPTVQVLLAPARTGTGSHTIPDTGLAEGVTYCYRLRATNTAGDSAYSNTACGVTAISLPAAPTGLSVAP